MRMRTLAGWLLVALAPGPASATGPAAPSPIDQAVHWSGRPAADVARDPLRHPSALLAFADLKPGEAVADLMPGGGYFTRLFSRVVGPQGHVYAIVPAELAQVAPKTLVMAQSMAADPALSNVKVLSMPIAQFAAPARLDLVWTSDNYHDVYGFFGSDKAAAMDRAIFAALKPGGMFVVIDHVAAGDARAAAPATLHRIDPAVVRSQVVAAGFVPAGESDVLHRPEDDHSKKVFDPAVRGRTDQFVYRFRKPAL
jgi:predicted methyltransferase